MTFQIGTTEPHVVRYEHDRFWGRTTVTVDGQPIVNENKPLAMSVSTTSGLELWVGTVERHHVVIQRERKWLFAGFRPWTYRTFVDGALIDVREG